MTNEEIDNIQALEWRRDYLALRVKIKQELGAENIYDARERRALVWALRIINLYFAGKHNEIVP